MERRSCSTNLIATLDVWSDAVENGIPVDTTYLDLAFLLLFFFKVINNLVPDYLLELKPVKKKEGTLFVAN